MCLYLPVRVRPGYGYVCTHVRRVELFLRTLVCKHCIRLILFACIISVQLLPEFCAILPMLEYCFFNIFWCCCYIVVCVNTCQCCLLAWCVINGVLSVSHENQYSGGRLPKRPMTYQGAGSRFPSCVSPLWGVRPRGLTHLLSDFGKIQHKTCTHNAVENLEYSKKNRCRGVRTFHMGGNEFTLTPVPWNGMQRTPWRSMYTYSASLRTLFGILL